MLSPYLQHLHDYYYDNRVAILSGLGLLVSSGVKTLPVPGTPFKFYYFVYDWAHQFLNITNTRLNPTPPLTPPESAAPAPPPVLVKTGIEREASGVA